MKTIHVDIGQRLYIVASMKLNGNPAAVTNEHTVAANMVPGNGGSLIPMTATIEDGKAHILYDTVGLSPGTYYMDARITHPDLGDNWTGRIQIEARKPITPPSPR